ncbi:replication restart DNA helicase PriA [Geothermobacter ehrlichii]|uniref:Replication restart protein PriA n=1 Tax=Geothermobacter ehrlichii TaxID=213224 RepID=A0A5D3WIU6_9BACT|nr:replication restart DNA helicase PriA [Geothermobacter ehrlichii]
MAAPLTKTLSYLVPDALAGEVRIGMRLSVPLGRRRAVGFLLELTRGPARGLKPVAALLDPEPLIPETLIPLFRRAAAYYQHPIGQVIATALPAGLAGRGEAPPVLRETFYRPTAAEGRPRGERQARMLELIRMRGEVSLSELRQLFPSPYPQLKRLLEAELVSCRTEERLRDPFLSWPVAPDSGPLLTAEQDEALKRLQPLLEAPRFETFLLHGVTGSGKTEVYLRAIDRVVGLGRTALVLVPEIALTPQLVARFRARFAGRAEISVLHSGLSDGERYDAWRSILRGRAEIVIGARSAVFAPLQRLGLIVVDEEHEASYKQSEGFRYHARDLALLRGQQQRIPVLLGSATPSLPSYHRMVSGQGVLLTLRERAGGQPLPTVELVDMTETLFRTLLSEPLVGALRANLERGEQSLLLLNRRGFAPYLLCGSCGRGFRCPNCDISLTWHRSEGSLRCHYCDFGQPPPDACPACGGIDLDPQGAGTERLEAELSELFPAARIARMDRDTTSGKGAHRSLVEGMLAGRFDILVGTQMVAKGHDFPGVTLVGVLNADAPLNFPDFRAGERTFALLAQVAGRAGRGDRPGRVLLQTFSPDHYVFDAVVSHDYRRFCEAELAARRSLGYPPFGHLVNLVLAGNLQSRVEEAAAALAARLQPLPTGVEILGPVPCLLPRLRGRFRMQILLKASRRPPLRQLLDRLAALSRPVPAGVSLAVDVDPVDMF